MADLTGRVFRETLEAFENPSIRVIVNIGGTRSGKTYSTEQVLALVAYHSSESLVISVVTQTFPQLRQGAMRDWERSVLPELPIPYTENKSTHTWTIGKSIVEYFSAEEFMKVLGGQRDILFINECNRLPYEVVRQLMVRTAGKVFLDCNPVSSFWLNEHILSRSDVAIIHSTYLDNKHLSASQVAEIESHRHDKNWWRVYGEGLEGRVEGLVFPDWDLVDAIPDGCRTRYGIDFGYNDPTAVVRVGIKEQDLYLEELCYEQGLVSSDISQRFLACGLDRYRDRIIGDSAAPVQIEELHRLGWNIHPCLKGAGSIVGGINLMKGYHIHITKNSTNLQKELLNYMWEKDKNDKNLDIPIDDFCHLLDAARYATRDLNNRTGGYSLGFAR